jgi:hypothetical protein
MATFEKRTTHDDTTTYRVKVRRKGSSAQTATAELADAKKWAHTTEGAVLERWHFHSREAKRHTVREMIDPTFKGRVGLLLSQLTRMHHDKTERLHANPSIAVLDLKRADDALSMPAAGRFSCRPPWFLH